DHSCQLLRSGGKARRRQLLSQHLLRQERWTADGRKYLSVARPRECSCKRVLGPDRVRPRDGGLLSQFDVPHGRFLGQRSAKECRWLRGHLRRPKGAHRQGVELDLHPAGEELVPVVSILWPGEGDL